MFWSKQTHINTQTQTQHHAFLNVNTFVHTKTHHACAHTLTHTHTHQQALHSKGVGQKSVKGSNPPSHSSQLLHLFFCSILICNRDKTTDTGGEGRVLQWEASVRRLLVVEVFWERQRVGTDRITMVINLHMVSPITTFTPKGTHHWRFETESLQPLSGTHTFSDTRYFVLIVTYASSSVCLSDVPVFLTDRYNVVLFKWCLLFLTDGHLTWLTVITQLLTLCTPLNRPLQNGTTFLHSNNH